MPKATTYNNVQNIAQTIRLNEPKTFTTAQGVTTQGFLPAVIITTMQAVAEDGGLRDMQSRTEVGAFRVTPYTPQELYTLINGTGTGAFLAGVLKTMYADATNTAVA